MAHEGNLDGELLMVRMSGSLNELASQVKRFEKAAVEDPDGIPTTPVELIGDDIVALTNREAFLLAVGAFSGANKLMVEGFPFAEIEDFRAARLEFERLLFEDSMG
jgi:hypothetical protein